jgi:flavin reductase (DIM6/NTAB) family NADH-FMN oxidoreductase RutF
MDFDFTTLPPHDRYRLLCSFVAPRPIALVTTRSESGRDNAAPISFFNVFGENPAIVILGISVRADGQEKDTLRNIRREGEFVANMVDMAIARQMIVCSVNFPEEVDEVAWSGLTPAPFRQVAASRIAESPCAMGCRVERIVEYPNRALVFGEVVEMTVRDDCIDAAGRYVDPGAYQPIARLHHDNYIVADRQFELRKPAELLPHEAPQLTRKQRGAAE